MSVVGFVARGVESMVLGWLMAGLRSLGGGKSRIWGFYTCHRNSGTVAIDQVYIMQMVLAGRLSRSILAANDNDLAWSERACSIFGGVDAGGAA